MGALFESQTSSPGFGFGGIVLCSWNCFLAKRMHPCCPGWYAVRLVGLGLGFGVWGV